MENYQMEVQVRWSDLDPNVHIRHSVYYDWGAFCRIQYLGTHGLTTEIMQQLQVGPILFREECVFKKEIRLGDKITIDLAVLRGKKDFSRWTIQHTIRKNENTVAAIIVVDGAWLDTSKRKLATPPPEVAAVFSQMPLDEKFQWLD
jgi:acyl-CoA thioester hydrolase